MSTESFVGLESLNPFPKGNYSFGYVPNPYLRGGINTDLSGSYGNYGMPYGGASNLTNPYAMGAYGAVNTPQTPMSPPLSTTPAKDPPSGGGGGGGLKGMPYGSAALGLVQLGFAIPAMIKASKLKYQNYGMTPEMTRSVSEANAMRNIGFTGSEYNAYNQQLGQDRAATFARSRELGGGNLASTMMAILNGQNVNARNQLAIQDAALRRQNIATSNALNQETQNLANMNTQLQNQITEKQKQAAAGLMQSSLGNLASVGNAMGGMNADMVKALGGIVANTV